MPNEKLTRAVLLYSDLQPVDHRRDLPSQDDGLNSPASSRRTLTRSTFLLSFLVLVFFFARIIYNCFNAADNLLSDHLTTGTVHSEAIGTVKWHRCTQPGSLPDAECGYIVVPLDFSDPTIGTARVALARYRATKFPRKGMVMFNPGGPGVPGTPQAYNLGDLYQRTFTGEDYDILGFDIRGIGETEPPTDCFQSPDRRALFRHNTVLDRGFESPLNVSDDFARDSLIYQHREAEALFKTQFDVCYQTMGDQLKYMGTTTIVRDIDFITRTLEGEDALINFVGESYGTILGQYLINMLPDRIGRILIDGIVDPAPWPSTPLSYFYSLEGRYLTNVLDDHPYTYYRTWLTDSEEAYKLFFEECYQAGLSSCPLVRPQDTSGADIQKRVDAWIQSLSVNPMPVTNYSIPGVLTTGHVHHMLFIIVQVPQFWPTFAARLASALAGDAAWILDWHYRYSSQIDLERSGVSCNDRAGIAKPNLTDVVDETLDVLSSVSRFAMAIFALEGDSGCEYWPVAPPERFTGPWDRAPKNPILIMSNNVDPITPLVNARTVNNRFGQEASRLVIQNGVGHVSSTSSSLCMANIKRAYFRDGTLPMQETICEIDRGHFFNGRQAHSSSMGDGLVLDDMMRLAVSMGSLRMRLKSASVMDVQ